MKTNWKRYMHPYAQCCITNNSQDTEATWVSTNTWLDTDDVMHTHMHTHNGILLSIKKNEPWHLQTWMNLKGTTLIKVSQTKKEKHCMYFTCLWNLTKQKGNRNGYRKQIADYQKGQASGQWTRQVKGIMRYKLPVLN